MKDHSKTRSINKRRHYSKLTALPFLITLFSPCTGSDASTTEPLKVVVQKGESLSTIIKRELNNKNPAVWKQVAEFNNQAIDKTLEVGDILLIPSVLILPQVQLVANKPTETSDDKADNDLTSRAQRPPTPYSHQLKKTNLDCNEQELCWGIEHVQQQTEHSATDHGSAIRKPIANATNQVSDKLQESTPELDSRKDTKISPTLSIAPTAPAEQTTRASATLLSPNNSTNARNDEFDQQSNSIAAETDAQPSRPAPSLPDLNSELDITQAETDIQRDSKPGLFEVDEDSAVRALERSLIQLSALLLKPGRAEITFSFNYRYDIEFEAVLVNVESSDTDAASQQAGQIRNQIETYSNVLDLKFGLPYDTQLNLSVPFINTSQKFDVNLNGNSIDTQDTSQNGTGDYSITLTKTLATEKGYRPDILFDATYTGDTGSDEFGSNSEEFTLGLSTTKRQDPLVFTGSISHTVSLDSDSEFKAGDVTQFSIGTLLAASPYTSLQFFLTQTFIKPAEINNQPVSKRTTLASFSTGVSSVVGNQLFFNAQLGMGLVESATDFRLAFSISKQFSF